MCSDGIRLIGTGHIVVTKWAQLRQIRVKQQSPHTHQPNETNTVTQRGAHKYTHPLAQLENTIKLVELADGVQPSLETYTIHKSQSQMYTNTHTGLQDRCCPSLPSIVPSEPAGEKMRCGADWFCLCFHHALSALLHLPLSPFLGAASSVAKPSA